MTTPSNPSGRLSPDREALLLTTMSMTVDQRVDWLEEMMAIAAEAGALPKRVPDQMRARHGDAKKEG
jgi:hypothetical protein